MDAVTIVEVVTSVIAVGTVVFAVGRFVESVKVNTKVTEKMSDMIDGHLRWSAEIAREHDERFHAHDVRITRLEDRRK